ncbi:MAG: helix-turn-helix transcriptional regulator [Bacteroidales bacterium]|nr:helix-turn-helix transcriptional regulator [Bacteroidales bacterium]MCF8405021.1 helix-turn-helix transcriptional regulator [Bacteroidales bacterium]
MITEIYIPTFPLSQFIDHFFYYSGYNPEHSVDRFLPDGEVQIIFDLTDYPKFIYDNDTLKEIQSCQNVWFAGFRTEPITIPSGKESEMLIVQFKKGKAFPFLIEPMQNLTNFVVDAELVISPKILKIRERLLEATNPYEKFQLLEKQLLKIYFNKLKENPFVDFAVSTIIGTPKQCSIKTISDKVGYSQKHTIKLFKEHVGVTPKEFLKVIRFQKAIQQIENQISVDWSQIAFDCGFYDQSHFIADFKVFSGFTPSEYIKQRGDFLNYIPVK